MNFFNKVKIGINLLSLGKYPILNKVENKIKTIS